MQIGQFVNTIPSIETAPANILPDLLQRFRQSYKKFPDLGQLGHAITRMAMFIVRLKELDPEHLNFAEQCLMDIVEIAVQHKFQIGADALRYVFEIGNDFYRFNHLDKTLEHPIGEDRQLVNLEPQAGKDYDVVKPHITSTSYCGWTRCNFIGRQGKNYILRYINTDAPVIAKQKPFFAPLGSRTPNFQWRLQINLGDRLDAIDKKNVWYPSTVVDIDQGKESGSKSIKVSYRIFDQKGDKVDTEGQRYFGLSSSEDEWLDVTSSRIQRFGSMHKKLCNYVNTSNQFFIDDTYDLIFEKEYQQKPFDGIMRLNYTRSLTYLNLYRKFIELGGHQIFIECLNNPQIYIDNPFHIMVIIANCFFLVPRMGLTFKFHQQLNQVLLFVRSNAKQLNNPRYEMCIYYLDTLARRLYSYSQKQSILYSLRKDLALVLLKQNLEKQLVGLRILQILAKPQKPYTDQQIKDFHLYLKDSQVFYMIYVQGVHESIITRSIDFLRYLIDNKVVAWTQIDFLWNLIPQSDLRGRALIEKLFADLSKTLPIEFVEKILTKILEMKETELTIDNLNLLKELKNREDLQTDSRLNICTFLWDCISVKSMNIKNNIEEEVEKVFQGLITTLKDNKIRTNLLKAMCLRLSDARTLRNEIALMKDYILTYPTTMNNQLRNENPNIPLTINEVVHYLRQQNIYQTLLSLLQDSKNSQKKNTVLNFLGFLFKYDDDDITGIVRTIYQKTGPSDVFMNWAKSISHRASTFFIEMFDRNDATPFQNLTQSGFEALKGIFLDINSLLGNIRILFSKSVSIKTQTVPVGPVMGPVAGPVIGPMPQQPKMFIYSLKSPLMIRGIVFLQQLLFVVKNSKVYEQIVKLIVKFTVSLDESLQDKSKQIREQFCNKIVNEIRKIEKENVYNERVKIKLQTYISFINEIFCETQIHGINGITPHFQTIQGECILIKVENLMEKDPKNKDKEVYINQHSTLWRFKMKLGELIGEDPCKIDVIKYKTPMTNSNNGKSVGQLFFNNQSIKIDKKNLAQIPKHDLLNHNQTSLSIKFHNIVTQWFQTYKNESNQIGIEELRKLSTQSWKIGKQQQKLNQILQKHDIGNKGYLTFGQFENFFLVKTLENPQAVWRKIYLSGYKNNLKRNSQPQIPISIEAYPRKILSRQEVYDTIFCLLANPTFQPVHFNFYRLLAMIQTDTRIKSILRSSEQVQKAESCPYKLAYTIQIMMSLISKEPDYYYNFYKENGLNFITNILETLLKENRSIYSFDGLLKMYILPNLIWIFNMYALPLHSNYNIIRFLSDIKINVQDLDQIVNKLANFQKMEKQDNFVQKRQRLLQMNVSVNWNKVLEVSNKILNNLVVNYVSDFLFKLTNEIAKLCSCGIIDPNLDVKSLIVCLKSQSLNLRRTAQNIIYLHLKQNKNKFQTFLEDLLKQIPSESKYMYSNFFTLLSKTIEQCIELSTDEQFFIQLARLLLAKIQDYPVSETRNTPASDKVMLGLLINLNILVQKKESVCRALIPYKQALIEKCLFFSGASEKLKDIQITSQMLKNPKQSEHFSPYVKCKHEETRKVLYCIIEQLHKFSSQQDPHLFSNLIMPIIRSVKQPRKAGHKSLSVGLNNLGSTCYMNAMLQILNSIGPFRNTFMMMNIQSPLIDQLKNLFGYLFFSERIDYMPKKLLMSFNPPINPALQQDTTEFLNYLFDQIENSIRDSPYSTILQQLFKGSQVAQMICHACGARRQRKEEFFSYSVEIQGKYELKSALEGMHQGQVIADCLCESCGVRADTTKRNVLSEVPSIFFIHLKRIVFNYDVFVNTKIHTRLQFPNELNFQPYTKEGLDLRQRVGVEYLKNLKDNEEQSKKFQQLTLHGKPKDSYLLKLKGIIVHSGTAEVGHYISIVQKQNGWVKFDDSRVSIFGMSCFESQCYGGTFQSDEWGGFGSSVNAYVLVYQKVVKEPLKFNINDNLEIIPFESFSISNSVKMYKQVWLDNHQQMIEDHLLSQSYCKDFLNFCVNILSNSPNENIIECIGQLLLGVSVHSGQIVKLQELFRNNVHQIDNKILQQFILLDTKRTFGILFHYQRKIREFMSMFIETVLIQNYRKYEETRPNIIKFLQEFYYLLHSEVSKNWLRCDGYFRMFNKIVVASIEFPELYQYILSKNFISVYIDFVMEKSSPIQIAHKKYSLGTKSNPISFESAMNTIVFLLQRSFGFNGINYQLPPLPKQQMFHLSDNDILCLSFMGFYQKMLRQRQNLDSLAIIIQRLAIQNLGFSEAISRVLLKCVNEITDSKDQMKDLLHCICSLLTIADEHWLLRAEFIIGYSAPYIFQSNVITTLDEDKFVYASTLDDLFPVQCLLAYAHINRLRNPLAVVHIISTILKACSVSQEGMIYICQQVSPSYRHCRYIDWVRPFIENVQGFVNLQKKQKEQLEKEIQIAILYLNDLEKVIKDNENSLYYPWITGDIIKRQVVSKIQEDCIQILIKDTEVYCLNSQPTGNGNKALDDYLQFGRLNRKIDPNSNLLKFVKRTKQVNKNAQKTLEEIEQKLVQDLFDEETKPKGKEQSMQIQKALQMIPQEASIDQQLPIVNLENVTSLVYFKEIQLHNKSDSTKNVTLYFLKKSVTNVLLPTKVSFSVGHKSNQSMWIFKLNPYLDWGNIQFTIKVQQNNKAKNPPPSWFKLYGQLKPNQQLEVKQKMEPQPEEQKSNIIQNNNNNIEGQISCSVCTFFNPSSNLTCEVCGSELSCS